MTTRQCDCVVEDPLDYDATDDWWEHWTQTGDGEYAFNGCPFCQGSGLRPEPHPLFRAAAEHPENFIIGNGVTEQEMLDDFAKSMDMFKRLSDDAGS